MCENPNLYGFNTESVILEPEILKCTTAVIILKKVHEVMPWGGINQTNGR